MSRSHKGLMFAVLIQTLVLAAPILVAAPAPAQETVSQCLDCHSTPARIIPAMNEVLRAVEGMPGTGGGSKGEG